MEPVLISPAKATLLGIPTLLFSILFTVAGIGIVLFILYKRAVPLLGAAPDSRTDRIGERISRMFLYPHHRMPRYIVAATIHMSILSGFAIFSLRWLTLVLQGLFDGFVLPGFGGAFGAFYTNVKDLSASIVLVACIWAMIRRGVFEPERYAVPERFGKSHKPEAVWALVMITGLMVFDMLIEGSVAAAKLNQHIDIGLQIPLTGAWIATHLLSGSSAAALQGIYLWTFYLHLLLLLFFVGWLPFGRLFHLIAAIPDLFTQKLNKGTIKPVKWGVAEDKLDDLESFGVKKFEDFTWKHILDFYACADCGRCSDNCPANAVGRPLSPRFISIKGREYAYKHFPVLGQAPEGKALLGEVYAEDEIWSCTTCGACEEECPIMIEYIDKIVDLRRGMVDEGMVPQSLQKPLSALEKRGNPYGKMEKKRVEWTKAIAEECPVKILKGKKDKAQTLYFVDSVTSYDDRIQEIAQATSRVLTGAGIDFGILGPTEKDSGHDVRRFGEEMLFMDLRDQNSEAILASGVKSIVTADPHAYNALKHDYNGIAPVEHMSQVIARQIAAGKIKLKAVENPNDIYVYHDPCYLGRHNEIYDDPREVIDAIPGVKRMEMQRCRDRSFCCGGGGLMLFYEPIEETRMGKLRVEMAQEVGATVIVTACPFCLVNIEDGIKTSGLEGQMQVIDLVELVDRHMVKEA